MTCANGGCNLPTSGKSKYCSTHKREAREAWLSKVRESAEARQIRDEKHTALWRKAVDAALTAHKAAVPVPMTVVEKVGLSDENTGRRWYVPEGACGFGRVTVTPGNSSFAIWLTKNAGAHKSYHGGVSVSTNYGSQSYERAEAAAQAMADVLREAGIKAYASANLD